MAFLKIEIEKTKNGSTAEFRNVLKIFPQLCDIITTGVTRVENVNK